MPLSETLAAKIASDFFSGYEIEGGERVDSPTSLDLAERHDVKPIQINKLIENGNWSKTRTQRDLALRAEGAEVKEKCEHVYNKIIAEFLKLVDKGRISVTAAEAIRACAAILELHQVLEPGGDVNYRELMVKIVERRPMGAYDVTPGD